jgi:AmiR/NasT family two-component response regulator
MFLALESGISMTVQQERIATLGTELDQLRAAVQDNKIVEQATGAISVRYRMSPTEAFEMLRDGARAQRRNPQSSHPRSRPTAGVSPEPSSNVHG